MNEMVFFLFLGAGLDKFPKYSEKTDDRICTQYTSANCDKYWLRNKNVCWIENVEQNY